MHKVHTYYKFGNVGFELLRVWWEVPVLKLFVSVILLIIFFTKINCKFLKDQTLLDP